MTTPHDAAGGREWNPYEMATPIAREPALEGVPIPLARSVPAGAYRPAAAQVDSGDVVLASLGARLGAALIDAALWCIPLLFVVRVVMQAYRMSTLGLDLPLGLMASKMMVALLLWAVLGVWNMVWLVQRGQTIGKRIVGIRIVRPDGSPADAVRVLLMRGFAFGLAHWLLSNINPLLSTAFWLADVLFIFSEDRRCLHDRFADTVVVNA